MSSDQTTARDFLEAICAEPDDDTPRLVFSDWLEEHGQGERAELIRVQLERNHLPQWDPRQVRLRLRERKLIAEHGPRWKAELPKIPDVAWGSFRRGFVAEASFDSFEVLGKTASTCWAATPVEAAILRWPRSAEWVDTFEPIPGLREMIVNQPAVDRDEVRFLANAPLLSTLRSLTVAHANLGFEGFAWLVTSPHLGKLQSLRLPSNYLGNGAMRGLLDAHALTSLTELDLSGTGSYNRYQEDPIIQGAGIKVLMTWSGMARLRSLKLSRNDVGLDGLRILLRSPYVAGLKELDLRSNGLSGSALETFGNARPELRLESLNVGENLLKDLGGAYLTSAPCLSELKALTVDRCELSQSAARRFAKAPFMQSLRLLNMNDNNLGPEGLYALLEAKPPLLHTLQVANNDVLDEGALHLAESAASQGLVRVNLADNGLGDHAAEALAASAHLGNLVSLRLTNIRMTASGKAAMLGSPLGKRLENLEMGKEEFVDR